MGVKMFGIYMLLFIVYAFTKLTSAGIQVDESKSILNSLALAAEAGATKWDKQATAEAGMIVIDEAGAEAKAQESFFQNTHGMPVDPSKFLVEVVNNAPVTLAVNGEALHFESNGIIVKYDHFTQIAEADDR
ncbi:MAG TPA: hypothetical protein VJ824_15990 [Bacillota bacterium]|nr:hypothetical protein [Bacillota bacterium]